jgi:hypothetical protein
MKLTAKEKTMEALKKIWCVVTLVDGQSYVRSFLDEEQAHKVADKMHEEHKELSDYLGVSVTMSEIEEKN